LEVLGDVVPVRGMVRHQIAPTILEQLKVREVEVLGTTTCCEPPVAYEADPDPDALPCAYTGCA
jgi:hypothetical protein